MKSPQRLLLRQKNTIDILLLCICPLSVLCTYLISTYLHTGDFLRTYAWLTLIVEIGLFYLPARLYIDKLGGTQRFGLTKVGVQEWVYSLILGAALFYVCTAANALVQYLFQSLGIQSAQGAAPVEGGWRLIAYMALVGVIPAIAEETFFRGALLNAWLPFGKRSAYLHTAAAFALLHFNITTFPVIFGMGLFFAYLSNKTGACYASMGAHMGNNIMALYTTYLVSNSNQTAAAGPLVLGDMLPSILIYLLMGLTLGFFCLRALLRAANTRQQAVRDAAEKLYKAVQNAVGVRAPSSVQAQAQGAAAPRTQSGWGNRAVVILTYAMLLALQFQYLWMP